MKIITETNLTSFKFWAGATDLAHKLTYSELNEISEELEIIYPDGMTDVQINDLFWFDEDFICKAIGKNIDEVLERQDWRQL